MVLLPAVVSFVLLMVVNSDYLVEDTTTSPYCISNMIGKKPGKV